jgi:hypothetical protein
MLHLARRIKFGDDQFFCTVSLQVLEVCHAWHMPSKHSSIFGGAASLSLW